MGPSPALAHCLASLESEAILRAPSRSQKSFSRRGIKTILETRAHPGSKSLMKSDILTALESDGRVLN